MTTSDAYKRSEPETCPFCRANLIGKPIPEESREMFGGVANFSRVIGIYDVREDRTILWQCPDCGGEWERK